jgi:hypothetical protein
MPRHTVRSWWARHVAYFIVYEEQVEAIHILHQRIDTKAQP